MKNLRVLFTCLLVASAAYSFAWGPTGHRVVGTVAEQYLTPKARKAVQHILDGESVAMASTWMDEVRSDSTYDHVRDWHWVTIPDSSTYAASAKNPNGDLVEAIERMKAVLRSDTASPESQRECLRFLIHLVGDLHQTLHVGRGDDKGGNSHQVQWMKKGSNLHRVWDSGIIELQELSYSELASSLRKPSRAQVDQWRKGTTVQWAEENLAMRPLIYSAPEGADIGYAYAFTTWPVVKEQLLKGGVRLAAVLNEVFR
jgi:hypothetical protein